MYHYPYDIAEQNMTDEVTFDFVEHSNSVVNTRYMT